MQHQDSWFSKTRLDSIRLE